MKHPKLEIMKHIFNRPTISDAVGMAVGEWLRSKLEEKMAKKGANGPESLAEVCLEAEQTLAFTIKEFREKVEKEIEKAVETSR